jgi:hypothetical protein
MQIALQEMMIDCIVEMMIDCIVEMMIDCIVHTRSATAASEHPVPAMTNLTDV